MRETVGIGSSRENIVGVLLEIDGLKGEFDVLLEYPVCSFGSIMLALYESRVAVGIARSFAKPPGMYFWPSSQS